jgi:crossover junction endodeoxyribonuclease RuvC
MVILGIDPGLATIGFGVVETDAPITKRETPDFLGEEMFSLVDFGIITTQKNDDLHTRLQTIEQDLKKLIKQFKPDLAAIEELFFTKNVTNGMQVAHARGVIILTLKNAGIVIHEYKPNEIKLAITGDGGADKQQIKKMVKLTLNLPEEPGPDDAADAIAIALTAIIQQKQRPLRLYRNQSKASVHHHQSHQE